MKLTEKNYAIVELPVRQYGRFVQLPTREVVEYIGAQAILVPTIGLSDGIINKLANSNI